MDTEAGPNAGEPSTSELPELRLRLLGGFGLDRGDGVVDASGWRRPGAQTIVKLLELAGETRTQLCSRLQDQRVSALDRTESIG